MYHCVRGVRRSKGASGCERAVGQAPGTSTLRCLLAVSLLRRCLPVCLLGPAVCVLSLSPGVQLSAGSPSSSSLSSLLALAGSSLSPSSFFSASSSSSASSFAKPRYRIRLEAPAANISNFTEFRRRPNFGLPANQTDYARHAGIEPQLTCCCVWSTIAGLLWTADCKNLD